MKRSVILIIVCSSLIVALSTGMRQSFGLFLPVVSQDLGWSAAIFAFAIALQNLVWGLSQPLIGMVVDRFGPRLVLCLGCGLFIAGLVCMATSTSPLQLYLGGGLLVGLAVGATGFGVLAGQVSRVVPTARRTAALGIVGAVGSFGSFVIAPFGQYLIERHGWSLALLSFAGVAAMMLPFILPIRAARHAAIGEGAAQTMRQALREASGHSGYLLMTAGFFVCGFQLIFILTHLPVFLAGCGVSAGTGAKAIGLIGLFNAIGTYGFGTLGDYFRKKHLLAAIYVLRSVVMGIYLALPISELSTLIFASAMGLLWLGTAPLTGALVAQMFGLRYMSTLYGFVFLSHQLGSFLGAWLGGIVFAAYGSYNLVWGAAIGLGLFAAMVHLPMDDRPVERLSAPEPAIA